MGTFKYDEYKKLLKYARDILSLSDLDNDFEENFIDAKKALLKTKYQRLYIKGGKKKNIEECSVVRINKAFKKSFLYLKGTIDWYDSRIKNYEKKIRQANGSSPITDIVGAIGLAKEEKDDSRLEYLTERLGMVTQDMNEEELTRYGIK